MSKILKLMEWNIRGATSMGWSNSYSIEKFVENRIMDAKADIIILVEFVVAPRVGLFSIET